MSDDNGQGVPPDVKLDENANFFYLVTWYWTAPGAGGFTHAPFFTPKPIDSSKDLELLVSILRKMVRATDQQGGVVILRPEEIGIALVNLILIRGPRQQVQATGVEKVLQFPTGEPS